MAEWSYMGYVRPFVNSTAWQVDIDILTVCLIVIVDSYIDNIKSWKDTLIILPRYIICNGPSVHVLVCLSIHPSIHDTSLSHLHYCNDLNQTWHVVGVGSS